MSTTNNTYYVYLICGEIPGKTTVIIQPVPAVPNNIVGNVILDLVNKLCWELVDISSNLSQLQNNWIGVIYDYNYFDNVSPTIYTCENCNNFLKSTGTGIQVKSKCPTNLRNWSNCANADVSGVIYIGSNLVYSFTSTFDTNLLIDTLDTNDGDVVDITLIPNVTNSVVTLNVMYNGFSLFSQTSSSDDIRFVFTINCDSKINPYQIDIFSTCNQIEPSIVLYSTSYNENDLISTTYYSSVNCLQTNVSPEMTWVLNGFDTSKVVSYEILCEDLNASGSSPDGYFVHWWVTDINNNQLNIPSSGSWISGNVLPTDYGYGDDDNGWNGPCPSSSPLTHDYRIRISALLDNGNIINSNYSIFQASCISPFC